MDRMRDALERAAALAGAGRTVEAMALLERLLALAPAQPDALNRLGVWAAEAGDLRRAVILLERLLVLLPGNPLVRVNLAGVHGRRGVAARAAGDHDGARRDFRRALALRPEDPHGWCNLGVALDGADAAAAFRRALALAPAAAVGWKGLARLAGRDAVTTSRTAWTRAARLVPDDAEARLELALAAVMAGEPAAEGMGRIAVALAPGRAAALLVPSMLRGAGGWPARAAAAERALRLEPDLAGAWINLANARHGQDRAADAEAPARRAVALAPGDPDGWSHLALALLRSGRPDAAGAGWRRALTIDPEHAASRWHRACLLLLHGRLAEGWREYEWRWAAFPGWARAVPGRRWDGEDPRGLTLLLTREQGLGDLVQFIRFAADLRARGARVLVEGPAPLRRLLENAPGVDGWVDAGEEPPAFDRHVPLMSVPGLLGIDRPERIPAPVPYLRAEPERVERWRQRLGLGPDGRPGLRVGLVWRGSNGDRRSLPLAALEPLGRLPGLRLISLQKEEAGEPHPFDRVPAGLTLERPGPGFDDGSDGGPGTFLDSAAVMTSLDLVLTIDTATAHLAGALGVPAWVMLHSPPEWRWLLGRDDTPWYPTLRLFRQATPGDWAPVVARVADALAALATRRPATAGGRDVGPERMRSALERAAALVEAGRAGDAMALVERLLALAPTQPDALNRLGVWAAEAGDLRRAVPLLERLDALLPGNPLVRVNLAGVCGRRGVAAQAAGDRDGARRDFRRALALRPDGVQDWCNLGASLDGADAAAAFRRALALAPAAAEGWKGLARLAGADVCTSSRTAWTRLARLAPRDLQARLELVAAAMAAGDPAEAERLAGIAVALAPGDPGGWYQRALALFRSGRLDAAAAAWRRALAIDPEHAASRWHLSFLLLLHGRLAEGWREYEWRWRAFPQRVHARSGRAWTGEDPRGLTLLLTREQGLGDLVQFIRFAADLRARGARVLVEGPASLRRLLVTAPGVDGWVNEGEPPPPVDRHAPLMSLPGLLGIDRLDRIPTPVPYLRAEPERVGAWSARLGLHPGGGPGLRVGLVWRGSAVGRRSVPAAALAPLGRVAGVRWIALHKADEMAGDPPPSKPGPGLAVESPGPGFDGGPDGAFLDTAALAVLLDLVVSVDTAAAHVAG
ncbi:tetratricopeptide repeat protein, partial [Azospirillum sp. RWY-5-1]